MWTFRRNDTLTALEIGTSKVVAIIAQLSPDEAINIVGFGEAKSRGVLKGEIVDAKAAHEDIRAAIHQAEDKADLEVHQLYLAVTGQHIRSHHFSGSHAIASADRPISPEDVEDVMAHARRFHLGPADHMLHVIRQYFMVDENNVRHSPVGMSGSQLSVVLHAIQAQKEHLQSTVKCLRQMSLEPENLAFSGLASGLAVLSPSEKEEGALVMDLGGGVTEYVLCSKGIVSHSGLLAVGGDHVTQDLATGLKCSFDRAEDLKRKYGAALVDEGTCGKIREISNETGLTDYRVEVETLQKIMHERLKELLRIIAAEIHRVGAAPLFRSVVLCGGGAHIPQISLLTEQVFGCPVKTGKGHNLNGPSSVTDRPEYATSLGLLKFGAFDIARERELESRRLPLGRRLRNLFRLEN